MPESVVTSSDRGLGHRGLSGVGAGGPAAEHPECITPEREMDTRNGAGSVACGCWRRSERAAVRVGRVPLARRRCWVSRCSSRGLSIRGAPGRVSIAAGSMIRPRELGLVVTVHLWH